MVKVKRRRGRFSEDNNRRRLRAITGVIYSQIILDFHEKKKDIMDDDEISKEYIKRVCQLPTDVLEYILLGDEQYIVSRAIETVDAIKSELVERALLKN
ncbi:MAG: hypothetical protein HWN81_00310 [Candidatus Lokiarchaeota archaeon]|nr:hypothetical protein [Candidatus Lokiarchaeota archaeon]